VLVNNLSWYTSKGWESSYQWTITCGVCTSTSDSKANGEESIQLQQEMNCNQLLEICPAPSIIFLCMMLLPKPSTSICLFFKWGLFDSSAHYEKKKSGKLNLFQLLNIVLNTGSVCTQSDSCNSTQKETPAKWLHCMILTMQRASNNRSHQVA